MSSISRQGDDIEKQPYIDAHEHNKYFMQEETKVNDGFRQYLPKLEHDNSRSYGPRQEHSRKRKIYTPDARPDREILVQVFGPSTDYRSIRKAAFQEYLITTDFKVARLPSNLSTYTAATFGVAYVSAFVGLGISLGFNFASAEGERQGPDILSTVRSLPKEIPRDVQEECLDGIAEHERPRKGDWFAIWGASSNTGLAAIQLAKLIGLRVIAVADLTRHGKRLVDLGVDVQVDRNDPPRAIAIIANTTNHGLKFGLDTVGKETAGYLQEALNRSRGGQQAHLVGLTGLPEEKLPGIYHYNVPIRVFHTVPMLGEQAMEWLEQLLIKEFLHPPDIFVAFGGLESVNGVLDDMRNGAVSGKRIVVPVGNMEHSRPMAADSTAVNKCDIENFQHADKLNSDPSRIKFAYWVPNVSGGLVVSKIKQRTMWDLDSNARYARTAERYGFEYALTQENQHESVSFCQALLHHTERLRVMAALLPGPWNPAVAAKQIASIDQYSKGRAAVNIVSGWFKTEFSSIGQWWLDHDARCRRSYEFVACLRGIWSQEQFNFDGDFYQFRDYPLKPKPISRPDRPYPEIFQGGNSAEARENAAAVSDYYFMNGNTLEGFQEQIKNVRKRAEAHGRTGHVKFAVNAFIIARESESEALQVLQEIRGKADKEAVDVLAQQVKDAVRSTRNKSAMAPMEPRSKIEELVQYSDGFRTKLIGTPAQIADRIMLIKSLGVDILLTAFLHYDDEIQRFGEQVISLVRKLEAEGRGKDKAYEISLTGDVYQARKQ
ncbi:MAG: hypothetical protein LQ343_002985 [Gyalolechia ehrenbergii]|nr:MAG: hypothetical protein LQ343_002985 [Gyalolechia ehrenbergii]